MPRYIAINPDGDSVFNCHNQSDIFPSIAACMKGIIEELDDVIAEKLTHPRTPITRAMDTGWRIQDYSIFKELP